MRCLIHVNGPPGIGKSTRAALYADRHPGTLNLDVGRLHGLVGGWRDPAQDTHTILRPVALAMTRTHLAGGRDVQLLEVAANRPSAVVVRSQFGAVEPTYALMARALADGTADNTS
jgi:hypothetical protein